MVPPNLLVNPGADAGVLSPWVIGGSGVATLDDGTARAGINPHAGLKDFYGGVTNSDPTSTLTQNVCFLNGTQGYTAAQLDSGTLSVYISFYKQSFNESFVTDEAHISLAFRILNNTLISQKTKPLFQCTNSWCTQSFSYSLPIGTRCIDYTMIFQWVFGSGTDSYLDDNSFQVY